MADGLRSHSFIKTCQAGSPAKINRVRAAPDNAKAVV